MTTPEASNAEVILRRDQAIAALEQSNYGTMTDILAELESEDDELLQPLLEAIADRLSTDRGSQQRKLTKALLEQPQSLSRVIEAAAGLGRMDQALSLCNALVARYPDVPAAYLERVIIRQFASEELYLAGRIDECEPMLRLALADCNTLIQMIPDEPEVYLQRGRIWLQLDEFDAAEADFLTALELQPDLAPAYLELGRMWLLLNELDDALSDFTKAIELIPDDPRPYQARGTIFLQLGQPWEAMKDFQRALELDPTEPAFYYMAATAYQELREWEASLAAYTTALELDPDNFSLYTGRARVHRLVGNEAMMNGEAEKAEQAFRQALADLDQALSLAPEVHDVLLDRAHIWRHLQEHDRAWDDYTRALELHEGCVEARVGRGEVLQDQARYQEAMLEYQAILDDDPEQALGYYHLAEVQFNLADYDTALENYARALDLDPDMPNAYLRRANIYVMRGSNDEALNEFDYALSLIPNSIVARTLRATVMSTIAREKDAAGQTDEARALWRTVVADCDMALQMDPDVVDALIKRGHAYSALGLYDAAIDDFTSAIEIEPNSQAYTERALLYSALGETENALEDCEEIATFDPDDPSIFLIRCNVHLQLAQQLSEEEHVDSDLVRETYRQALEYANHLIERDPDIAVGYRMRGDALTGLGRHAAAQKDYAKANRLEPKLDV